MCLSGAAGGGWGVQATLTVIREACKAARRSTMDAGVHVLGTSVPWACSLIWFSLNGLGASSLRLSLKVAGRVWSPSPAQGQMLGVACVLCTLQFRWLQGEFLVGKWSGGQAVLLPNTPLDSGIGEGPRNSYGAPQGHSLVRAQSRRAGLTLFEEQAPPLLLFTCGWRLTECIGGHGDPQTLQAWAFPRAPIARMQLLESPGVSAPNTRHSHGS